jgi:YVTN family beta-propeller protein
MSKFFQQSVPARVFHSSRSASKTLIHGSLILGVAGAVIGIAGCGSNLRPTVTPIVGTGPASQPASYAFVISAPTSSPTAQGYGTVIDYSGDTIMASAPIGPGPMAYALNSGSQAWTLNVDGTVSNIPFSTQLQEKQIAYSTLNEIPAAGTPTDPAGLDPVVALYGGSLGLYALDVNLNEMDVLTGSPDAFKLDVPVDQSPVTMVHVPGASRAFVVAQNIPYLTPFTIPGGSTVDGGVACTVAPHSVGTTGFADGIETATYTISSHIPVGVCPDYAIGSPDTRRVFVLNRGSDTISVINSQFNTIDQCTPFLNQNGQKVTCHACLPLSTAAISADCPAPPNGTAGLPAVAGPVYAEFNPATEQIVVSNYDGNTVSIIDVTLDEYGNDSNTYDASGNLNGGFGTTYTVPVGKNPAAVTVLADGSRAYTANQTDGTVTVINMVSHSVETTLPVTGNPRTVVSTQNSLFGKVYVISPNSPSITIIRTDQDIIDTTVLVQGNAVDARVTSPNATSTNVNLVSRLPGAGQPCNLPPAAFSAAAPVTLANCKAQDPTLLSSATLSTSVRPKGK